jgi:hypothetical protein
LIRYSRVNSPCYTILHDSGRYPCFETRPEANDMSKMTETAVDKVNLPGKMTVTLFRR